MTKIVRKVTARGLRLANARPLALEHFEHCRFNARIFVPFPPKTHASMRRRAGHSTILRPVDWSRNVP
jgi:hypothetical protein